MDWSALLADALPWIGGATTIVLGQGLQAFLTSNGDKRRAQFVEEAWLRDKRYEAFVEAKKCLNRYVVKSVDWIQSEEGQENNDKAGDALEAVGILIPWNAQHDFNSLIQQFYGAVGKAMDASDEELESALSDILELRTEVDLLFAEIFARDKKEAEYHRLTLGMSRIKRQWREIQSESQEQGGNNHLDD